MPLRWEHAAPTLTGYIDCDEASGSTVHATAHRFDQVERRAFYCSVAHCLLSTNSIVGKRGKIQGNLGTIWYAFAASGRGDG